MRSGHLLLFILSIAVLGLLLRYYVVNGNKFINTEALIFVSMMRQTIANNFVVPTYDALSGFPVHSPYTESPLLIYLGIIPFWLSGGLMSLTYGTYLIQALFALLGMLATYLLTKQITRSQGWGLFGMLMFALQPTAIVNNSFRVWRGDSFVPALIALSTLVLLCGLEVRDQWKKYLALAFSAAIILFAYFLWKGGAFALVSYAFVVCAIFAFNYTKNLTRAFILVTLLLLACWLIFIGAGASYSSSSQILNGGQLTIANFMRLITQTSVTAGSNLLYFEFSAGNFPFGLLYVVVLVCGFIFTAFPILLRPYKFGKLHKEGRNAFMATATLLITGILIALYSPRFNSLIAIPLTVLVVTSINLISHTDKKKKARSAGLRHTDVRLSLICLVSNVTFLVLMFQYALTPASLSPAYQSTMLWIQNSTPANSTFLTWHFDGTAIEGWANRTSFSDAFLTYDTVRTYDFSRFMFAKAYNFSYLYSIRPNYLLVRYYWYNVNGDWAAIEQEGGIPINYSSLNGTNMQLFESSQKLISNGNVTLQLVYSAPNSVDESIIYKISYS